MGVNGGFIRCLEWHYFHLQPLDNSNNGNHIMTLSKEIANK